MIAPADVDEVTQLWVRNKSDETAVKNGCFFDVESGAYTVWWIERYCRLYEGEWAGEHVLLRSGCPDADHQILDEWDDGGREQSLERARLYAEWKADGNHVDWQYECTMRIFGWTRFSERWARNIRRFNAVSLWVPKKQKKTPTLAAWGVYLTCGDGEAGGKNFGGAKDGNQANIAMAHALAMIEQSPELDAECKINKNENSITHMPTRSFYKPLSSANDRSKRSKEGINGNILIDETHVVDRDFIDIISRAGISRSEPLRIEVSTAGNNPDGYGRERQDYARQVESGAITNDQLFVAIYEAPQKLTDEDLAKDPCKYGKLANPAWGHTAHEEEFLADYEESRRTISGLGNFKMYRLNIWQSTANQWLRLDDWVKCGRSVSMEDYAGKMASVGMDLSKTRDMSALAVELFDPDSPTPVQRRRRSSSSEPVDRTVSASRPTLLFVNLWMTERYARENSDKAAFNEWEASGHLNIIPGDVIQESYIRRRFEEICDTLQVKVLVKDKTYAADFTEWCEEQYPRILQVDYPQSPTMMEKPIDDFEADVIDGKVGHNNNLCLNWQAGHAAVVSNARGYRIIQKPQNDDVRKVDGMVASVMSHWGTKQLPKHDSPYKRRGVLTA